MPDVYLWSRHVPVHMHTLVCAPPFTLKRSMYDYKLYVSLLIFVYSLMDSDERASLQKKVFWIKQPSNIPHEHVVQCFTYNAYCILQVLCIQKNIMRFVSCGISLQACGGWAGSSQNCGCRIFSFTLPGEDPMFGSITRWDVHQSKTSMDDFKWMKLWT